MASSLTRAVGLLCACTLAIAAVRAEQGAAPSIDTVLVHRFSLPHRNDWASVVIRLSAGGWHMGQAQGRSASALQLRIVLRDLVAIEIGARCVGWIDGPTVYPCGFSFRNVDFAGAVAEPYSAIAMDWEALNLARDLAAHGTQPERHASDVAAPRRRDAERFVALRLPPNYLGDQSATLGGTLRFEVRALTNAHAPSNFDRSSGLVILRARPRGDPS